MQNKHGLIFVAQRKLIASYWKTPTFHGFGQMCLSEVLCLTMLKLGGQWHKSQQLTQLQPVWEAHAASTFLWDQQRGLFSKWLGGLWSIDLLNFAWFTVLYLWAETQILLMAISFIPFGTGWLEEHLKWNRDDELSLVFDIEVWKWNCLSVGATSQDRGCLVKWRVPLVDELNLEELALNIESLYAKQTRTDFCCSKKTHSFLLENSDFSWFGQMCLSEVLCLTMLKLGGQWHKSQQLTQLQPVWEAHAASTFLWDQQRGLFSKWLGGLWSIDLLNFAWFTVLYL